MVLSKNGSSVPCYVGNTWERGRPAANPPEYNKLQELRGGGWIEYHSGSAVHE